MSEEAYQILVKNVPGLAVTSYSFLREIATMFSEAAQSAEYRFFERLEVNASKSSKDEHVSWAVWSPDQTYSIHLELAFEGQDRGRTIDWVSLHMLWTGGSRPCEDIYLFIKHDSTYWWKYSAKGRGFPVRPLSLGWLAKEINPSDPLFEKKVLTREETIRALCLMMRSFKALA